MSVPYLRLIDLNGNTYNFDNDFWLTTDSWSVTRNIINRSYAHGGRNTADGFIEARQITIEGAIRADTLAELETKNRALQKAIIKGGYLYVSDDTVDRFILVSSGMIDSSYQGEYRNEKPITINFIAENPFWQDDAETNDISIVTGNENITVDNSGSDDMVFPVIQIDADQGEDLPSIKMTQKSDGVSIFEYNDPNFVQGDSVVIDCQAGTVKRNNNNSIEFFTVARFIRLQNVDNTIAYEGGAATITFKFRKVYL